MNATIPQFHIAAHINDIVTHVFQTMLALPAAPIPTAMLPPTRVSGCLGIAGERVTGSVYLHFPAALARAAARAMLQCAPGHEAADGDINDAVGELSNMIGCRLKSLLNDADVFCAVSTPSVIRGAFTIEVLQGVTAKNFYFRCLEQPFAVEIHLELMTAPARSD